MKDIIIDIRKRLDLSQEDLAKLIGISFATVNRWENGHSVPNTAAQLRLYDICKDRNIDLESIILNKIKAAASDIKSKSGSVILYHGSKSGLKGKIAPLSRDFCDFGKGFYMGTDPYQPLTLISDYERSKFYVISIDLTGLKVINITPDLEWAMLVAYNRGKMKDFEGTNLYKHYSELCNGYDVICGCIADDRMFYVLDSFFAGNITDKALVMSLSALKLGQQYVAVNQKSCSRISVEKEIELSVIERAFLRDMSEANRAKGISYAKEICRDYRREGKYFDEILKEDEQRG